MATKERRLDIKVGDVGTEYRVPIYDDDLSEANFDPSSASTKQLRFKMPGASGLCVRDATAEQVTIDGSAVWCLTYTVTADDVKAYVDESEGGFHQAAGPIKVEGYLVFSASEKWSSSTVTVDYRGRELRVTSTLA